MPNIEHHKSYFESLLLYLQTSKPEVLILLINKFWNHLP